MLPPIVEVSPEEARADFDEWMRHWMRISGEEFARRYDAGEYDEILDDGEHWYLIHLEMMLPFVR